MASHPRYAGAVDAQKMHFALRADQTTKESSPMTDAARLADLSIQDDEAHIAYLYAAPPSRQVFHSWATSHSYRAACDVGTASLDERSRLEI